MLDGFQTERLTLRPCSTADVDDLHKLWTDPEVRRWLWDDSIIPREEVIRLVEESMATMSSEGRGLWMVHLRDGIFIGFGGLRPAEWAGDDIELLYGIYPAHWGSGYASEAARRLLQHAFEILDLDRVVAAVDVPNVSSARVLDRIGMSLDREGDIDGLATRFYTLNAQDFARSNPGE